jgi:hypothetical protein
MSDQLFNEQEDYLTSLVGEGKRYATVEDLAKAAVHKDNFIETLKSENKTLRDDLSARAKLEDVADRLLNTRQHHEPEDRNQPAPTVTKVNEAPDVEKIVSELLERRTAEQRAQDNLKQVVDYVQQTFGEDHETKFKSRLNELGLSAKEAQALAMNNPTAFTRILGGAPSKPADFTPPRPGMTPQPKSQVTKRDWAYYQELKTRDPKAYADRNTQVQMHRDAIELGENFFT